MYFPALLALCLLLAIPANARTFTNTAGKTIEAEIINATMTTVTLKLASGKKSNLKLSLLSEADQKHVKKWLAEKLPSVRVTPNFVRSNRDEGSASDFWDDDTQIQVLKMTVEIENFDKAKQIEGGEFSYILVGRDLRSRNQYKILAVQKADLDLLPNDSSELTFKTVKNVYEDSGYYKRGAKCIGYVLYAKRKSDDREIYASASTPILERGIHSIINLKAGEMTDSNFIKIPPKGAPKSEGGDVISVE